jgi:hypothetical protein
MKFTEIMKLKSDKQLADILTIKRAEYQEEALIAAQVEFDNRTLDINNFVSADDIIKTDTGHILIEDKVQELELKYKLGAFLAPMIGLKLGSFFSTIFFNDYILGYYLSFPIIVYLQYYIYSNYKNNGFITKAKSFKNWSLSYYILIVVLLTIFVLESAL